MHSLPLAFPSLLILALPATAQIPGIGPKGPVTRPFTGFTFTEGPAQDAAGNLYFSDVQGNRIHKVDTASNLTTFLTPSGNANGIFFDRFDRMLVCRHAGDVVQVDTTTKAITTVAGLYNGKRFNSPNDLCPDVHGGVWFTDPTFGGNFQDKEAVYYQPASGPVARVVDLVRPNGILLSPREDVLYVASGTPSAIMAYPVLAPGSLGTGTQLFPLGGNSVDGMTIDTKGNLYLARGMTIEVITPQGKSLGTIPVAERPSNCAFGGPDLKTLYITARTSLYKADMESTGHRGMRLAASGTQIPIGGGRVDFGLVASPLLTGRVYALVGGMTGEAPGVVLDRTRLPVNLDAFTDLALALANTPLMPSFIGLLDAAGSAKPALVLPKLDPGLIGLRMTFAGLLLAPIDGASNARSVVLVP
jgi:gluconolactonase